MSSVNKVSNAWSFMVVTNCGGLSHCPLFSSPSIHTLCHVPLQPLPLQWCWSLTTRFPLADGNQLGGEGRQCCTALLEALLLPLSFMHFCPGHEVHLCWTCNGQLTPFSRWSMHYSFLLATNISRWLSGKESTCQRRRLRFDPWVRKDEGMETHSNILAWRIP